LGVKQGKREGKEKGKREGEGDKRKILGSTERRGRRKGETFKGGKK